MRATEFVTEMFDAGYPISKGMQFASSGEVHAEAYDADGRIIDISFTPVGYGRGIEIVFKRGGSYDLTGQGDAPRVLATVVNAISMYLQKYQPPYIAFSAKSTGGRVGAYTAMIKRHARGYTLLDPEEYPEEVMKFLDYLGSDKPFVLVRNEFLRENTVDEMALKQFTPMGDFDKPGPFRGVDKRLVPHPTNQLKTAKFFERTPYDFRLFFSNIPGTGKYGETGPVNAQQLQQMFGEQAQPIIEGSEDAITTVEQGVAEEFLGKYPSILTTLGEATHPDLVKYDKKFQKQLHRDLDVGQRKGKKIDIDYDSDEKDWSDLTHIQYYTGRSLDTNDYLHRQYRNKAKVKELTIHQAKIQAMDRILANHKLPQQIVVYTGLSQSPAEAWETYGADVTKPIRLHLPAYTSTTTKLKVALRHASAVGQAHISRARHPPRNKDAPANEWGTQILMMTLPAGLPAASVKKISRFPKENEILLPRGIDIEINPSPTVLKDGDYVWHATVLSHSPVQIAAPMQENFADADESLTATWTGA